MTGLPDGQWRELQPEALVLLVAIRDHLDVPLYNEGDRKGRRAYRDLMEIRAADVLGYLNIMLAVSLTEVTETAQELRRIAAETPLGYETTGERGQR